MICKYSTAVIATINNTPKYINVNSTDKMQIFILHSLFFILHFLMVLPAPPLSPLPVPGCMSGSGGSVLILRVVR